MIHDGSFTPRGDCHFLIAAAIGVIDFIGGAGAAAGIADTLGLTALDAGLTSAVGPLLAGGLETAAVGAGTGALFGEITGSKNIGMDALLGAGAGVVTAGVGAALDGGFGGTASAPVAAAGVSGDTTPIASTAGGVGSAAAPGGGTGVVAPAAAGGVAPTDLSAMAGTDPQSVAGFNAGMAAGQAGAPYSALNSGGVLNGSALGTATPTAGSLANTITGGSGGGGGPSTTGFLNDTAVGGGGGGSGLSPNGWSDAPSATAPTTAATDTGFANGGSLANLNNNPPAVSDAGGDGGGVSGILDKIGIGSNSGDWISTGTAGKLALGLGTAAYDLSKPGVKSLPGYQQLSTEAGQLGPQAAQLESYVTNGTLPPGAQAAVDQATQQAVVTVKSRYASMGQSGSTAEAEAIAGIQQNAAAQGFQIANQLLQSGISESGLASSIYQSILSTSIQQNDATISAISGLAGALGGGGTVIKL
jgi:hypothetical protein